MQQLEGNIKFGLSPSALTDFSDEVAKLEIMQNLQTTSTLKTFANAKEDQNKSGTTQEVGVTFLVQGIPAKLARFVFEAQLNDSTANGRRPGEIFVSATEQPGAADPVTNPEWTGWVLPTSAKVFGGTVGQEKTHDATWPGRNFAPTEETS